MSDSLIIDYHIKYEIHDVSPWCWFANNVPRWVIYSKRKYLKDGWKEEVYSRKECISFSREEAEKHLIEFKKNLNG